MWNTNGLMAYNLVFIFFCIVVQLLLKWHSILENVNFILKLFSLVLLVPDARSKCMTLKTVKKIVRTLIIPVQMHDKIRLLYTIIIRLNYDGHMYEHSTPG